MNDLPDLPFEKVLSYMSLRQVLKARAVSRLWCQRIDSFRVRSLCFSEWEEGYIDDNRRLLAGKFAQNFIVSSRFQTFFAHFGQSILSGLRHFRVCDLHLEDSASEFIEIVNSFPTLESLDFVRVDQFDIPDSKLTLPNLKSIRIDEADIFALTLDTPALSEIRALHSFPRLSLMHPWSVLSVQIGNDGCLALESLTNLKTLYLEFFERLNDTLLSSLEHLEEIHLKTNHATFERLHDQKRRYARNKLKIYCLGVCLASSDDYPDYHTYLTGDVLKIFASNYSKLADQLPFYYMVPSSLIESVSALPADFSHRLIKLGDIHIDEEVVDVELFLNLLGKCPGVRMLTFSYLKSYNLLSLLSDHHLSSNIQCLELCNSPDPVLKCLLNFKNLTHLIIDPIDDVSWIPKFLKELKFIRHLWFDWEDIPGCVKLNKSKKFNLNLDHVDQGLFSEADDLLLVIIEHQRARHQHIVGV